MLERGGAWRYVHEQKRSYMFESMRINRRRGHTIENKHINKAWGHVLEGHSMNQEMH